jgi:GNAT superfamily N-acetyltransferase
MGELRIRALDAERELDAYLAVANQARTDPISRERWLEVAARALRPPRHLVGEADGRVVVVASVGDEEFADDCASAWIGTSPAHRRQGHGRAMLAAVDEALAERRKAEVRTAVKDDDGESRAWAERRGFTVFDHTFQSRLDLAAFDASRHRDAVERAEAAGLRLARFGPGDDPDRLYDLFVRLLGDVPDQLDPPDRAFFQREMVEPEDAFTILAYDGDVAVGLASLLPLEADEYLNAMTGVLPEYRGRGLARALKVVSGEAARAAGRRFLVTNNNARNAPMLAVNDALGFVREAGLLHLRRRAQPPSSVSPARDT